MTDTTAAISWRALCPARDVRKPVDTGNGIVAASFAGDGSWLSVGGPHSVHGFVELSGMPPFDETWRGDPEAVRRYRSWMTEDRSCFLRLELADEDEAARTAGVDEAGRPIWHRGGTGWSCQVTAWAPEQRPVIVQRYRIRSWTQAGVTAVLRLGGRLDRAAVAEITEVDPPAPLMVDSTIRFEECNAVVESETLPAAAVVSVIADSAEPIRWSPEPDGGHVVVTGGCEVTITITVSLDRPLDAEHGSNTMPAVDVSPGRDTVPAVDAEPSPVPFALTGLHVGLAEPSTSAGDAPAFRVLRTISLGALRYILSCTAFEVAPGHHTILTDHRLLPLSWTRDAYYQARLLLTATRDPRVLAIVEGHLRWLFLRARDRDGQWARSQWPDGRSKDLAVQADQQLYPLLELADYRARARVWPGHPGTTGVDVPRAWGDLVGHVWDALPREGRDGLLVSAENPADDRTELPFLLSTQILYWHTARRLSAWSTELGIERLQLHRVADGIRSAIARRFSCSGPFGPQWAYESDGADGRRRYHDANDLPTALAPLWGFCGVTDPTWTATMRFAFSPHNPGYVVGRFGGLGSAHTPGTWPLGDAQELAVALARGTPERLDHVVRRLSTIAGADGMLPETYEPDSGRWLARHWFAWPSAFLGTLFLEHLVPRTVRAALRGGGIINPAH